jgi:hypothetical protein
VSESENESIDPMEEGFVNPATASSFDVIGFGVVVVVERL